MRISLRRSRASLQRSPVIAPVCFTGRRRRLNVTNTRRSHRDVNLPFPPRHTHAAFVATAIYANRIRCRFYGDSGGIGCNLLLTKPARRTRLYLEYKSFLFTYLIAFFFFFISATSARAHGRVRTCSNCVLHKKRRAKLRVPSMSQLKEITTNVPFKWQSNYPRDDFYRSFRWPRNHVVLTPFSPPPSSFLTFSLFFTLSHVDVLCAARLLKNRGAISPFRCDSNRKW